MAKRQEWEFEHTAGDLAQGAQAQREFRLGRVAWWSAQKEKVMTEIRESGIEVSESLAVGTANYQSKSLHGPRVLVRNDLQEKLTECHDKIQGHQRAADEYAAWIAFLSAHPGALLKLHAADWQYFFGRGE